MGRKSYIGFQNGNRFKNSEVVSWKVQGEAELEVVVSLSNSTIALLSNEDAKFFLKEFETKTGFQNEVETEVS